MSTTNFREWALTEKIYVTQVADNQYMITRVKDTTEHTSHSPDHFKLTIDASAEAGRTLLFNDVFVDVDDDFISFISILDDYHEQNGGELGITLELTPFDDKPDIKPNVITVEYVDNLKRRALDQTLPREERFRAEAELEDMTDGHWDGPRTDDPPPNWWTTGDPPTGKWDSENGVLILPEDI
jgi:hypothetical protein